MFNPELSIGQELKNSDIVEIFKCGNMGGMRRSKKTNTLVLISDYTKGIYHDKWIGGVLHYIGMGKSGDQDINWAQNATLAECGRNGVDIHLFEVMNEGEYTYCGRVELVSNPYVEMQTGEDGNNRKVWMFPIRPVPDNDVKKPPMFVFKDMEDFKNRGKNIDFEYSRKIDKSKNKSLNKPCNASHVILKPKTDATEEIPANIIGKQVKHKTFGIGRITKIEGTLIEVQFDNVGLKKVGLAFCIQKNMLEFI